jgi:hypothetical protein
MAIGALGDITFYFSSPDLISSLPCQVLKAQHRDYLKRYNIFNGRCVFI